MARGIGEFNYLTSLALINGEEARSRYIDNKLKATNAYFQQRSINRQAREAEAGPRPSSQDVARYAKAKSAERTHRLRVRTCPEESCFGPRRSNPMRIAATERKAIDHIMAHRTARKTAAWGARVIANWRNLPPS